MPHLWFEINRAMRHLQVNNLASPPLGILANFCPNVRIFRYDWGNMPRKIQSIIHGYSRQKEEEQARLIAAENKLPYINLVNYPFTGDVLGIISEAEARKFAIVPFQRIGNTVRVATAAPFAAGLSAAMNQIGKDKDFVFEPYFCSTTSIEFALDQYTKLVRKTTQTTAQATEETIDQFLKEIASLKDFGGAIQSVSTTKLFETVLSGALAFEATDIHFEPQLSNVRIRFRIDGDLQEVATISPESYHLLLSRVKNLSKLKLNRSATPQDGRFTVTAAHSDIDVRVNVLPTTYGETAELRLLTGKGLITLEALGLNSKTEAAIRRNISRETGLIIITGPTGSGKTTTLYSILLLLNSPTRKIITIEDPVEYKIPGVEQIQVDPDKGFDFAQALRAVLRQDPDIILVGEIRDRETAEIAINASLTGHLVLTTLHTNSAPATFARLIEMGAPTNLLADAVSLVIAQRLVRKKKTAVDQEYGIGRTVISEFLEPDPDFGRLMKAKATISEFQELFRQKGYQTLREDLAAKIASGEVDEPTQALSL